MCRNKNLPASAAPGAPKGAKAPFEKIKSYLMLDNTANQ